MIDRCCGECTLCCKLLPMKADHYPRERVNMLAGELIARGAPMSEFAGMVDHFDKPANTPCQHQRHRKGCAIYSRRPFSCRMWSCRWLVDKDAAALRRPDRSRYVVDPVPDFITVTNNETGERQNLEVVQIWCDPATPDAWKDPALLDYLERLAERSSIAALIRIGATAISVFSPALCSDGNWHYVTGDNLRPAHRGDEMVAGVLNAARNVKL